MARKAKCRYCQNDIEKKDLVKKVGSKQYHISCYKKMIADKYNGSGKGDISEKEELYSYIIKLYRTEEVDPKIMAQIDKYHKEYELSHRRILLTLMYYYEIQQETVNPNYGIGIIPYVYKEAESFWIGANIANEKNSKTNFKNSVSGVKCRVPKNEGDRTDLINIEDL